MSELTPYASTFGGALIGLSAVLLMALNGRIAGISGISSAVLPPFQKPVAFDELGWRLAFIIGLIAAPLFIRFVTGQAVVQIVSDDVLLMMIAGVLTGFGAAYGGGCTSGHGVCGLSRLSMRSLVATCVFMLTAMITVYIMRHMIGA